MRRAHDRARRSCASAISPSIRSTSCTSTRRRLQHMQRLRPAEGQPRLRARLAGFGLGADQADTVVGRLSGGQKARLSLLLATHRRAASADPRRADQPPRHRKPRGAGRGADRIFRRGDPRQPRHAPARAGRRPAVAGQGRRGRALRRGPRAYRRAASCAATMPPSRAEKPQPTSAARQLATRRSRRCGPRSRKCEERVGQAERDARQAGEEAGRSRALRAPRDRRAGDLAEEIRRGDGRRWTGPRHCG